MKGVLVRCGLSRKSGKCVQKDDLTILFQEMTTHDAVVMGTPVYWYHVTAQFKMLVDRLYCFLEFGENPETGEQTMKSEFPADKNLSLSFLVAILNLRGFFHNFTII